MVCVSLAAIAEEVKGWYDSKYAVEMCLCLLSSVEVR